MPAADSPNNETKLLDEGKTGTTFIGRTEHTFIQKLEHPSPNNRLPIGQLQSTCSSHQGPLQYMQMRAWEWVNSDWSDSFDQCKETEAPGGNQCTQQSDTEQWFPSEPSIHITLSVNTSLSRQQVRSLAYLTKGEWGATLDSLSPQDFL